MSEHVGVDRMHALLDDALPRADLKRVRAHLGACESCAAELARLEEVVEAVRGLPREATPSRDLWPGIEGRITSATVIAFPGRPGDDRLPDEAGEGRKEKRARSRRTVSVPLVGLYAAGIALALLSGSTVWLAMGGARSQGQAVVSVPERPSPVRQARTVEGRYEAAVTEMEAVLEEGGDVLDPETLETVRESLETIDRAIAEAEAALERDPASPVLHRILSNHRQTKLRILRLATSGLASRS